MSRLNGHRLLELSGIAVALAGSIALFVRVLTSGAPGMPWLVLGAMATGYVLADLVSGIVHWAGDRFGGVDTVFFGPNFVRPFREHHVDPRDITRHDFVETNGNNSLASLTGLGGAWLVPVEESAPGNVFCVAVMLFTMLALFCTNQFHKWSHLERPPRWIAALQRAHLILPPAHHDVHHRAPFDTYYCITTGWLNRPLAAVKFFECLEWVACRILRWRVHRDPLGDAADAKLA